MCSVILNLSYVTATCRHIPKHIALPILGGIFLDSAVHDIDMVNWLIGEVPQTVYATGHTSHPLWKEVEDVDTSAVVLTYPSGAIAMIDVSRNASVGYDQRVEVKLNCK